MLGFFRVGNQRFVPDKSRGIAAVAQRDPSVVTRFVSLHRVSGFFLNFPKAIGGLRGSCQIDVLDLLLDVQQLRRGGEVGHLVVDDCAGDGGGVELPYHVVFAAGAVECGDRGRFVEVLVDRRDEFGR